MFSSSPTRTVARPGRRARLALGAAAAAALLAAAAGQRDASAQVFLADPDNNGSVNEYILDATTRTFVNARANAQTLGGDLASIANEAENRIADGLSGADTWIGFTDDAAFGGNEFGDTSAFPYPTAGMTPSQEAGVQRGEGFVWTDGTAVVYQNWGNGEPNNVGGENFAHIRGDGMWNDLPAGNTLQSIVERPTAFSTANVPMWRISKHEGANPVAPPGTFGPAGTAQAVIAGDTTPDVYFTDVINFSDSPADQDGNFPNETGIPGAQDNFVLRGTGFIEVGAGEAGRYTFGVNTDDGAELAIDLNRDGDFDDAGEIVAQDDALQPPTNSNFSAVDLTEGFYPVRYTGGENGGGASFEAFYALGDFAGPKGTPLFAGATLLGTGTLDVVQAIPEPGALSLVALGGLALLARRRRVV